MFVLIKQISIARHSRVNGNPYLVFNKSKWIPAFAPQGYSDLLSAKALAKSYARMTEFERFLR